MSYNIEEDQNSKDIELQTEPHLDKPENGGVHHESSVDNPHRPTRAKSKKRTKWASVRDAIRVTNAVKKPMSTKKKASVARQDSFLKKFSTRQHYRTDSEESLEFEEESPGVVFVHNDITVFKPDGSLMFYWLLVVTIAVLYNIWTCIVRQAFRELQDDHRFMWITFDILSDVIYILDIVAQLRTGYLEQGLMVLDAVKLAKRYIRSVYFKIDIISLCPLDFIQFAIGWQPLLRFPRFLKVYRSVRFLYMLETRTAYPNFVRVANLTHMLFLGCHWFAAFYFMISEAEGFHSEWSYPEPSGSHKALTRKYLASLFWSTLTLTTIGDLPAPETNWEYVFVIGSYLIGVFIFATIVGQVGNVITNRNASRLEFERLLDGAKLYMRMHNVPPPVQRRVQRWYDYVWTRGRMTGSDINSLGLLPDKLKTELAIHVNLETLKKVTIFNECQPEFLHDLVLKMKAYIFTPGDLICRRGEVAREMFIIADGVVEIISESGSILTQMSTGNFFGEIGILNLDGGINRRTADVKSVGYAELFVLSREDVLEALKDHPDAKLILLEYAKKRLEETMAIERNGPDTVETVNDTVIFRKQNKHSSISLNLLEMKILSHSNEQNQNREIIRRYAEQRLKQVLMDRRKLQETRSSTPPGDTTINHLLIYPSKSLFLTGTRKGSTGVSIKKTPSSKLDKLFRRGKRNKSKYRVGDSNVSEPQFNDINGDSTVQAISGNNELSVLETENQTCTVNENDRMTLSEDFVSSTDNCLSSIPLLNIVNKQVTAALTNTAEYSRDTNIEDTPNNDDKMAVNTTDNTQKNPSDTESCQSSDQPDAIELRHFEETSSTATCCRCGQLEDTLFQIEKQLSTVEKLYIEGIKQLETFNDVNEKFVQLLNMIPGRKVQYDERGELVAEKTESTWL